MFVIKSLEANINIKTTFETVGTTSEGNKMMAWKGVPQESHLFPSPTAAPNKDLSGS